MKKVIILENLKPQSINTMYIGVGRYRAKSQSAHEWSGQVFYRLETEQNLKSMKELREFFNPSNHQYELDLIVEYPKSQFYTKSGTISAKTIDESNWEKPLVDLLFLEKYFNAQSPFGCQNLNIDDKYITAINSRKRPSLDNSNRIIIQIKIEPKY